MASVTLSTLLSHLLSPSSDEHSDPRGSDKGSSAFMCEEAECLQGVQLERQQNYGGRYKRHTQTNTPVHTDPQTSSNAFLLNAPAPVVFREQSRILALYGGVIFDMK